MKVWLVVALSLVVVGVLLFSVIMTLNKWNFFALSTDRYQTNVHEVTEDFSNISINTDTADIVFLLSDNEKCKVECNESEKMKHSVSVVDGTLKIVLVDERVWYDYISINFDNDSIKIYLPKSEYSNLVIEESTGDIEIPKDFVFEKVDVSVSTGDVKCFASALNLMKIHASTGDVFIKDISVGTLDISVLTGKVDINKVVCSGDFNLKVSTGKSKLNDVNCKNFNTSANTGDIKMRNVIASEKFHIERSTGDVSFEGCDASEIFIKTSTGDVDGSLLSDKIFFVNTDTGSVNIPQSMSGGKCEIVTDTGNVNISIS